MLFLVCVKRTTHKRMDLHFNDFEYSIKRLRQKITVEKTNSFIALLDNK